MFVFVCCVIGVFALLMALIPSEFITAAYYYNPSYRDLEVEETLNANDLLVYDQSGSDNMTYDYTSLEDAPTAPDWEAGLPDGQFLEIGWGLTFDFEGIQCIKARQRTRAGWYPVLWWWSTLDDLKFYSQNGTSLGLFIYKTTLEDYFSTTTNGSAFYAKGSQISTSMVVGRYNESQTIGQNWDDGHLDYFLSYDVNFTASGISAWNLVTQLLMFQSPNLGFEGFIGDLFNALIAIPMFCMIAYIVAKIVIGLIPFLSGWGD